MRPLGLARTIERGRGGLVEPKTQRRPRIEDEHVISFAGWRVESITCVSAIGWLGLEDAAKARAAKTRAAKTHLTTELIKAKMSGQSRRWVSMIGQTVGHYRIEAKLGEGGMGVVYKARDTRLDRPVAIKVLSADAVANPERKRRFVQEAKAASALNHPNIITIYEIDAAADGADFIVMEYVDGKALDQSIGPKGLGMRDALKCAVQIADALSKAHAAGIVHRDLKPGNIMVTNEGQVKVLDFGLAKLTEQRPDGDSSNEFAATQSMQLERAARTEEGTIVGTVAYMSPEQAEGKKVDARSDIFSFGSVLYEMVTGRRAFAGSSKISTLSAILHQDPQPIGEIVGGATPELQRIISRCLRKAPERRFHYMIDVKVALEELREESESGRLAAGVVPVEPPHPRKPWVAIASGILLLAAGVAAGFWLSRPRAPARGLTLTRLTFDSGLTFEPAFSPDGKLVAYASDRSGDGNLDIWVQQVAGGEAIRLTRHAADDREPAFSPDGSKIAFRSERDGGGIYVVSALGGEERLIARQGRSPRFSPDGQWIAYWVGTPVGIDNFSPGSGKVYVVASTGASPKQLRADFSGRNPVWAPDGRHLLFLGTRGIELDLDWWVTPLETGEAVRTEVYAAFRPVGFLQGYWPSISPIQWTGEFVVFSARQGDTTNLWRIPIAPKTWRVAGPPQRLTWGTAQEAHPSLVTGRDGVTRAVFANLTPDTHVWSLPLDAAQAKPAGELKSVSSSADDRQPSLSADGTKLVFASNRMGNTDVWMKDLRSGRETALTATPVGEDSPRITPDGARVAYNVLENQKWAVYVMSTAGGVPERVCEDCGIIWDWSGDGKRILFVANDPRPEVGLLDLSSGKKSVLKHPEHPLVQPHLSPDDRWIVCLAQVGPGVTRVFVVAYRGQETPPADEWIAVTDGTTYDDKPRWSPDGNLVYFTSDQDGFRCIWAQRLDPATKRPVGSRLPIFHSHSARLSLLNTGILPLEISVARDKIVFNLCEITGNIWMAKLE